MAFLLSRARMALVLLARCVFLTLVFPAWAEPEIAAICDRAAVTASRESGVPLNVLRAISLTETGRVMSGETRPWPWTVNMEGAGHWFDGPDEVLRYVKRKHAAGSRSFDLGCFQINYRWHGDAFRSFEQMLDPVENARYAARFLTDLYQEFGDWTKAAGAYHSRTPTFARRYEARFDRFRARLADASPPTPSVQPVSQPALMPNLFPLLRASTAPRRAGSLVPLAATPHSGRLIEPMR